MKSSLAAGLIVVLAVAVGGVLFLGSPVSGQTGTVTVGVTDSPPASNVTHIYVTITDIAFQGGNSNTTVNFRVNSTEFDLLALQNVTKLVGTNSIPVGNYTMIRFNVTSAVATIAGANVTLNVPSNQVKIPFASQKIQVKSGLDTKIVLDITPDLTHISSSYNLRPVVTLKSVVGPG